jgi:hypothetical protein
MLALYRPRAQVKAALRNCLNGRRAGQPRARYSARAGQQLTGAAANRRQGHRGRDGEGGDPLGVGPTSRAGASPVTTRRMVCGRSVAPTPRRECRLTRRIGGTNDEEGAIRGPPLRGSWYAASSRGTATPVLFPLLSLLPRRWMNQRGLEKKHDHYRLVGLSQSR